MTEAPPMLQALYQSGWQHAVIAEAASSWPYAPPEKLLHCIWFDPRWRPMPLQTTDGRVFTVQTPGLWNCHPGPDFQQAVLLFADGTRQRGDVEIHRHASGWQRHRHDRDPRYNNVILHMFLWNDRPSTVVYRADGQMIPQVDLGSLLPHPMATYGAAIVLEDYPHKHTPAPGRCYDALRHLPAKDVQAFLSRAGDTRLRQRSQRWQQRALDAGFSQALYEAIMRSLGSSGHRQHFQDLAQLLSWQEAGAVLRTVEVAMRPLAAEALLFGMAGLLPESLPAHGDDETCDYIAALQRYWERFPADLQQRAWHAHVSWRQPAVRPANTPERRLAGMAQLLALYSDTALIERLLECFRMPPGTERSWYRTWQRLLIPTLPSYWNRRTHFGSRSGRELRLIGPQRALTIVVDAIFPLLLLFSQHETALQERLSRAFQATPHLPDNSLLRYITCRLLGNDPALIALVTGACQQQGLLQILADFCSHDEGDCQGCEFPLLPA